MIMFNTIRIIYLYLLNFMNIYKRILTVVNNIVKNLFYIPGLLIKLKQYTGEDVNIPEIIPPEEDIDIPIYLSYDFNYEEDSLENTVLTLKKKHIIDNLDEYGYYILSEDELQKVKNYLGHDWVDPGSVYKIKNDSDNLGKDWKYADKIVLKAYSLTTKQGIDTGTHIINDFVKVENHEYKFTLSDMLSLTFSRENWPIINEDIITLNFSSTNEVHLLSFEGDNVVTGNKLKNISNMFSNNSYLRRIGTGFANILDFKNITSLSHMFSYCASLGNIDDINDWDVSNVTDASYMFGSCSNLVEIDIPDWNTSNLTNIEGMFGECIMLSSIDIYNWDLTKTMRVSMMLTYTPYLSTIFISSASEKIKYALDETRESWIWVSDAYGTGRSGYVKSM